MTTETTTLPQTTVISQKTAVEADKLSTLIKSNEKLDLLFTHDELVVFIEKTELDITRLEKLEKENFIGVAGKYFKVADQHKRNDSHCYRGQKEALKEMLRTFKSFMTPAQLISMENTRAEWYTASAIKHIVNNRDERIAEIKMATTNPKFVEVPVNG